MASAMCRSLPRVVNRTVFITSARGFADKMMADPLEHATGLEKQERLAKAAGNANPFDMRVYKRGPGTKDQPNIIPSALEKRMIGCICEEDATSVNWMWLHKGEAKRCECGYWFKLIESKAL